MHLRGFVNLTGRLPSTVVAVWRDESGTFLGAFRAAGETMPKRVLLELSEQAIRCVVDLPSDWRDDSITGLSPEDVGMFALSNQQILAYPVAAERVVLTQLLADPGFASEDPFCRLALAKELGESHSVASELIYSATSLLAREIAAANGGAKRRVDAWLAAQRRNLGEYFPASKALAMLAADIPDCVERLVDSSWSRRHLQSSPPRESLPLATIEDRVPSPRRVAVLNIEPVAPDEHVQRVMIRHIMSGTQYLFFHAPKASQTKLDQLRLVAQRAIERARLESESPFSGLISQEIGGIRFFELDRQWTESSFVFYLELGPNGYKVAGYRGQTPGAPISDWYEKIPDVFASELYQALMSNRFSEIPIGTAEVSPLNVLDLGQARQRKSP